MRTIGMIDIMAGVYSSLRSTLRRGPMPAWRFSGRIPDTILQSAPQIGAGDPAVGRDIYLGRFRFAGRLLDTGGQSPFQYRPPSPAWADALHGFEWLAGLAAEPGELSSMVARTHVDEWISTLGRDMRHDGWSPLTVARRTEAWLTHSDLILRGSEHGFYRRFLNALGVHRRYLRVMARAMDGGMDHFHVARVLLLADWCLPAGEARRKRHAARLCRVFDGLLLPDGGPVTRNPDDLHALVAGTEQIVALAGALDREVPAALMRRRDQIRSALAALAHDDGSLAQFNGGGLTDPASLVAVLEQGPGWPAPARLDGASAYRRLQAGGTVVIADAGSVPPRRFSQKAASSSLAFEFSSAGVRFVMSMGPMADGTSDDALLARYTAAFSALVVADRTPGRFSKWFGHAAPTLSAHATQIATRPWNTEGATGFEGDHDGYGASFGLHHQRGLRLSHDGAVIDGYDRLIRANSAASGVDDGTIPFAIRFHLHPDIDVLPDAGGLVLSHRSGLTFRFSCEPGQAMIEPSAWFSAPGGMRQTRQICVHGTFPDRASVRWRFRRIEPDVS